MMTTMRTLGVVTAVLCGCLLAGELRAQEAPAAVAAPATGPVATSQAASLPITVTGVEGNVQVREESDKPWQKAVVGMTVTEGAEFRTGPRSAVRVLIPPDQTITLDRLGVIKLMQVLRDGNVVKTRVGMPFGRTRYDIEAAGLEHQSELVSPSSTLAIRGTKVSIYDQPPFAPSAVSLTGRAEYRTAKRQVALGGKGKGRSDVSADVDSPAEFSLLETYVDPNSSFGRPEADQRLINQLQSKGDIVLNNGQLALAFGPAVTDRQLADLISGQGRFNISLRWFGPGDFDLFVLVPSTVPNQPPSTLGNPSYNGSIFKDIGLIGTPDSPVTSASTPDGGRIKFDQIAFGGGGIELASWKNPVPQVAYTVAVLYKDQRDKVKNYPPRQQFRLEAFLDGKTVPVLVNFADIILGKAGRLEFGPRFEGLATLIESEKELHAPDPAKVGGDFHISLIDLTVGAIGPINDGTPWGGTTPAQPAAVKRASKNAKPITPSVPAPRTIVGPKLPPKIALPSSGKR